MHHIDFARRLLRSLDDMVAPLDAGLLEGSAQSYEQFKVMAARRAAYMDARRLVVKLLGPEAEELK